MTRNLGTAVLVLLCSAGAAAQTARQMDVEKARVVEHWTSDRRAGAIPRDLAIDPRGLGYLRGPGGVLEPYGHRIAAQAAARESTPSPFGKPAPGGAGDTAGPIIADMNPSANAVIGYSHTFSATVTDDSGVRSVTFSIRKGTGLAQSFSATRVSGDTWSVALEGFTDGDWSWQVAAKDAAGKGGNSSTSGTVGFKVSTGASGGGGGGAGTVANAVWSTGGAVQLAAGRLYFEMPANARRTRWQGYVCSGTVAADNGTAGRSVIITAAHCVYDDVNKAFARNVMFIPNQAGTTGAGTDLNCSNDPLGCWVPSFGVVDRNWTTRTFPDNVAWDYAFYVVSDSGAHKLGSVSSSPVLDAAVSGRTVSFGPPSVGDGVPGAGSDFTHALGYSYSEDPKFMYCADDMNTTGTVNWWLAGCGLSGGSSGGPWLQPVDGGNGPIVSVNSWGYTNQPGMAGPKLHGTSAACLFENARTSAFVPEGNIVGDCP